MRADARHHSSHEQAHLLLPYSQGSVSSKPLQVFLYVEGGSVQSAQRCPLTRIVININPSVPLLHLLHSFFSITQALVRRIFFLSWLFTPPPSSVAVASSCRTSPWHANLSPWFPFREMANGVDWPSDTLLLLLTLCGSPVLWLVCSWDGADWMLL